MACLLMAGALFVLSLLILYLVTRRERRPYE